MSMNRIQFQPGLSMPEFLEQFGTEAQCEAELQKTRWPQGFVCPIAATPVTLFLGLGRTRRSSAGRVGSKHRSLPGRCSRAPSCR
jgi:hypothetical protein